MASKRKLNQSVSLTLRDEEALTDGAAAAGSVGPLGTRTQDPLPPSDSTEELSDVEAERSEDAAGAEVTLAATAAI